MQKSAKLYRAAGPLLGNVGEKLGSGLLKKNQTQFSSVLEMQFESKSACVDLPRGLQQTLLKETIRWYKILCATIAERGELTNWNSLGAYKS